MKQSIVVIPDTQLVLNDAPECFGVMVDEILRLHESMDFKAILHVGDLVDQGAKDEGQFIKAQEEFQKIYAAGIPLMIAAGNHDYDDILTNEDLAANEANDNLRGLDMFNQYFGVEHLEKQGLDVLLYEEGKVENFITQVEGILYVFLEFGPRRGVLDWANDMLDGLKKPTILVTHSYLGPDGRHVDEETTHSPRSYFGRKDHTMGVHLWERLVSKQEHIFATFNGHHVDEAVATLVSKNKAGKPVVQCFRNWQTYSQGGQGRICIVNFDTEAKTFQLKIYNPMTKSYEEEEGYNLDLSF